MSYVTNLRAMPRVKYTVMINAGCTFSRRYLAVPYSMIVISRDTLIIGDRTVKVDHHNRKVWNVPESRLVDLSEDVLDLSETE